MTVGSDGNLQALAATRVDMKTFETAELGLMPMNTLYFPKPAETGTAVAVADFNKDGIPDVCFAGAGEGFLHVLYGGTNGSYTEVMKIEVGTGLKSLAAGDFNGDGSIDIAASEVGAGTLTIFYLTDPATAPQFRTFWSDTLRDYILGADVSGTGIADLLGAGFGNLAEVLDIGRIGGAPAGRRITLGAALDRTVSIYSGYKLQLRAALLKSNLSVNLQNFHNQLVNVVNVQACNSVYVVVGDIGIDNTIAVVIATPRK
jgi:hypothetical protein